MKNKNPSVSKKRVAGRRAAPAGSIDSPASSRAREENGISKVHIVFKTHLDIGFTELGEKVLHSYFTDFIPRSLALARTMREKLPDRRFRWTTGSWLIWKYLEESGRLCRKRMEDAILEGDICWHALPFTTHSEMLDGSLFDLGIRISKDLDRRFGRQTTGAKMTDVPGHTRGIVSSLQAAGITFLHIGVNPACRPPKIPQSFNWMAPDGSKMTVMYEKDYGGLLRIPGSSEVISVLLTGDNHGPQDECSISRIYDELAARFPGAELVASDLSQIAASFSKVASGLPVIKSEIGDSWIHGIGSDPLKLAQFRELSRLRRKWIQSGDLKEGSSLDLAFGIPLVQMAEHTWGLDVKTHLKSWDVYSPEDLEKARKEENFRLMEASWQEKRGLIQESVRALPARMRSRAADALDALRPERPDMDGWRKLDSPGDIIELPQFLFALSPDTGGIRRLFSRVKKREWASDAHPLAGFSYQIFSKADYDRFMEQYLTQRPEWALADLGKPGLENIKTSSKSTLPQLTAAWIRNGKDSDFILADLAVTDKGGKAVSGCPQRLTLEYSVSRMEPVIEITLQWFEKRANRLPEAMWLSFVPPASKDGKWLLDKMGQDVDARDVVEDGGHKMHAVTDFVRYADARGQMQIHTLDAPLVAPGERNLLNFDNRKPDAADGIHFCLCNNVWGTNFVMWFEDDMRFRFKIRCI